MLRLIIEKELRDITGDKKFLLSFLVCSLLIILAFIAGLRGYQVNCARYEASKRENLRQMEGITDWREVNQTRIFLPPQPLAALVSGISNDIGQTAEIHGRGSITPEDSRYGDDPIYAVFRFLDLDFIFQVILSLFAILFAYDSISGEKERGTLRLTFSNSVRRATYLAGKIAGSYLALAVPLAIPVLIGILIFTAGGIHLTGDEWLRLILIIASGFLLFAVFLTLSVFISALTHRSSTSFLILLILWVSSVLVIPRVSALVMGKMVDVPTTEYLASLKSRFNGQLWREDRTAMSNFQPSTTGQMDTMMKEFSKFMDNLSARREKQLREYSSKLDEDRGNKVVQQTRLSLGLARLSPAAAFSLAASTLAGTALSLKDVFLAQSEAYQKSFGNFMVEKTGVNLSGGGFMVRIKVVDDNVKPKPINPYELPVFEFKPPTLSEQLASVLPDWGLLIAGTLLCFAGSFIVFLRYDVR
jgi:ABC-type transport system involved in multi-copper enzyme maturation permease subunit